MTNAENGGSSEVRRKQLFFRAQRRGIRELDLIFGAFAAAHLAALDDTELDRFEALLDAPDDDVYAWLRGREPVPPAYASPVFDKLKKLCDRGMPSWNA
jgi:antitoxin CptB